jgi:hypothetical protein
MGKRKHRRNKSDDDDDSIPMSDGSRLNSTPKDPRLYFQKVNIFYGETGTGKTIVMLEAMKLLQNMIPLWFIICPTNNSNETYTGRIPKCCIKTKVNIKFLQKLYKRQEQTMEIFRRVNRMETLEKLFSRCADDEIKYKLRKMNSDAKKLLRKIERSDEPLTVKNEQRKNINKLHKEYTVAIYKAQINLHRKALRKRKGLSNDERLALKFLNLNPNVGLIFDDTGAEVEKYASEEVVSKFFYQGRHDFLTSFFLYQDDKSIKPPLRRSPKTSIFTSSEAALSFFDTKTNSVSKAKRKKAMLAIDACFNSPYEGEKNNRKLVYQKENVNEPFTYIVANNYEDEKFKLGCPALWEFSDNLPVKSKREAEKNNTFVDQYLDSY